MIGENMIVLYILLFVLVLAIVVCWHEYGHYFFAKKAGILVNEFAFGMGPKLISKKKGETYWSIRAIPIGGFCAMSGEEEDGTQLIKVGDEVKIVLDEFGKISKIIMKTDNPDYADLETITVESVDLFGKDMSPLYLNQYEVNRDAVLIYSKKEEVQIAPEERRFSSKTPWQRFFVVLGGPLNNIILALVVFLLLGFITGVATNDPVIGDVSKDSGAALAGLSKNDKIISIDGHDINSNSDIHDVIYNANTRALEVKYERKGVTNTTTVYTQYYLQNIGISSSLSYEDKDKLYVVVESKNALIGTNKTRAKQDGYLENGDEIVAYSYNGSDFIELSTWEDFFKAADEMDGGSIQFKYNRINSDGSVITEQLSGTYEVYSDHLLDSQGYSPVVKQIGISAKTTIKFFPCLLNGLKSFWKAATIIFSTLGQLFTSKEVGVNDLGGFITILNQTATYAAGGFASLLYWIGLLSINLGIINLLPIPALDGGRILFIFIEAITKKKVNPKVEAWTINIVFWLLLGFMGYILIQDIIRLVIQIK